MEYIAWWIAFIIALVMYHICVMRFLKRQFKLWDGHLRYLKQLQDAFTQDEVTNEQTYRGDMGKLCGDNYDDIRDGE